ncbi:Chitin synthase, class 3 [Puccinia graminis f. sp. tritici]|uniref:Chitin synthase, class 3 n=1 Tax=Puccinia graminis f. sp. tritici TaxID=56615 RepID=A0A5B0NG48_PUCGR|nr:Chitin synthase, class 3 [Puccinia graminis f. sp. tritici]
MKRWVEFERERRWRTEQLAAGTLNDNGSRNGTTLAPPSGRYSLNSSIDNWSSAQSATHTVPGCPLSSNCRYLSHWHGKSQKFPQEAII